MMRLWLKDSERKPDPTPVATDNRKPILIGLALWLLALATVLIAFGPLGLPVDPSWILTCVLGLGVGALGLLYSHLQQRRILRR